MKKVFIIIALLTVSLLYSCTNNENINKNIDYSTIKSLDIPEDKITLIINGNTVDLKSPIYLEKNRYFLCLNDLINTLGGTISVSDKNLDIKVLDKDISINIEKNQIIIPSSKELKLKEKLIKTDDFYFL